MLSLLSYKDTFDWGGGGWLSLGPLMWWSPSLLPQAVLGEGWVLWRCREALSPLTFLRPDLFHNLHYVPSLDFFCCWRHLSAGEKMEFSVISLQTLLWPLSHISTRIWIFGTDDNVGSCSEWGRNCWKLCTSLLTEEANLLLFLPQIFFIMPGICNAIKIFCVCVCVTKLIWIVVSYAIFARMEVFNFNNAFLGFEWSS